MIVVCGEALIDFTPIRHDNEVTYIPRPGGSPYNVAIGLSRLGIDAAFFGGFSKDRFGHRLRQNLLNNGVNIDLVVESDNPTTLALVHLPNGNEPEFVFYNNGTADRNLLTKHLPSELPPNTQAIHFGSISTVLEPSASTLEKLIRREMKDRVISFDPNVRPAMMPNRHEYVTRVEKLVTYASIVKVSRADINWLYPSESLDKIAKTWLKSGPDWVIVTMGADGAAAFGQSGEMGMKGNRVRVVDTVGAGDAFTSGLLASLHKQGLLDKTSLANISRDDMGDAVEFANRVASITCKRAGANPPAVEELQEYQN